VSNDRPSAVRENMVTAVTVPVRREQRVVRQGATIPVPTVRCRHNRDEQQTYSRKETVHRIPGARRRLLGNPNKYLRIGALLVSGTRATNASTDYERYE